MAALQTPTVSTCTRETARGKHVFNIADYSLHKGLGVGMLIRSAQFAVGGYDWCIHYYPDGNKTGNGKGYVSVYLELLNENTEVRAGCDFRLVTAATTELIQRMMPMVFNDTAPSWGYDNFKKRSEMEASQYLQDDRLVIPRVEETALAFDVQVPPSNLSDNLAKLLETEEESDVTFKVKGEIFHAHKLVLAMRSPVFKAELYGPMRDKRRRNINVEDMQPAVFKALLHFIYTDSLPSMDDLEDDENEEMVKH